ncbi:expressed unknown protein [Seminavis robusta]|uniref:Uncharacterized protein n=1 Tax=Seminavis robusta TaxID=568900 RepID=A0A9N8DN68_9STRA|nr:expressed unknown protein [Seminavis robusta]|eukprot:Sro240_g096150.1 n/a (1426) ;mRNA; r:57187-61948
MSITVIKILITAASLTAAVLWVVGRHNDHMALFSPQSSLRGSSAADDSQRELKIVVERRLPDLEGFGGEPDDSYFPLQLCQGDCDSDDECDVGLVCFQRSGGENVPGCTGKTDNDILTDYCILGSIIQAATNPPDNNDGRPMAHLELVAQNGVPASAYPLELCEGDCDDDSDCEGELVCLLREIDDPVPGCLGPEGLASRTDFCVYPPITAAPTSSPTWNPTTSPSTPLPATLDPTWSPTDAPTAPVLSPKASALTDAPTTPVVTPTPTAFDTSNAAASSPTTFPLGGSAVLDVPTSGAATTTVAPSMAATETTDSLVPTQVTSTPTGALGPVAPGSAPLPALTNVGNNGDFAHYPLGLCEGDCDTDDDCEGELVCFQRTKTQPVPGCQGAGVFAADYCFVKMSSPPTTPTPTTVATPSITVVLPVDDVTLSPTGAFSTGQPTQSETEIDTSMVPSVSMAPTLRGTLSGSVVATTTKSQPTIVPTTESPTSAQSGITTAFPSIAIVPDSVFTTSPTAVVSTEEPTEVGSAFGTTIAPSDVTSSPTSSAEPSTTLPETSSPTMVITSPPTALEEPNTEAPSVAPTVTSMVPTRVSSVVGGETFSPTERTSLETPNLNSGQPSAIETQAQSTLPTSLQSSGTEALPPTDQPTSLQVIAIPATSELSIVREARIMDKQPEMHPHEKDVFSNSAVADDSPQESEERDVFSLPFLQLLGADGIFDFFPLAECQGSCSEDSDCMDGLKCFVRQNREIIPGCQGVSHDRANYCIRTVVDVFEGQLLNAIDVGYPLTDAPTLTQSLEDSASMSETPSHLDVPEASDTTTNLTAMYLLPQLQIVGNGQIFDTYPLTICKGDCDFDEDCAAGLRCFHRRALEPVPGCDTKTPGAFGADYCVKERYMVDAFNSTGHEFGSADSPDTEEQHEIILEDESWAFHKEQEEKDVPPTTKPVDSPSAEPSSVPSLTPTDAPTAAPTTTAPSLSPTEMPSATPTVSSDPPSITPTDVTVILGAAGTLYPTGEEPLPNLSLVFDPVLPLSECHGDCNSHDDCAPGLLCYQRNSNEMPVPGCEGRAPTSADFCIRAQYVEAHYVWEIPGYDDHDALAEGEAETEDAAWDAAIASTPEPSLSSTTQVSNDTLFDVITNSTEAPTTSWTSDSVVLEAIAAETNLPSSPVATTSAPSTSGPSIEEGTLVPTFASTRNETTMAPSMSSTASPTESLATTPAPSPTANTTATSTNETYLGTTNLTNSATDINGTTDTNTSALESTETSTPTTSNNTIVDVNNTTWVLGYFSAETSNNTTGVNATGTNSSLLVNASAATPTNMPSASLPYLQMVGNDGLFDNGTYPLPECYGDCDKSGDCLGEELICMQRIANEPVPGCQGPPSFSVDYCVRAEYLMADNGDYILDQEEAQVFKKATATRNEEKQGGDNK